MLKKKQGSIGRFMERINVLGIHIDPTTYENSLKCVDELIIGKKACQIVTINPEFAVKSFKNNNLKRIANKASLVVADGVGIIWAAKFLSLKNSRNKFIRIFQSVFQALYTLVAIIFKKKYLFTVLPAVVTGGDLLLRIAEHSAKKGHKIFLFGGEEGVAKLVKEKMENNYKNIKITGYECGFGFDTNKIIAKINKSQAQILFVAFGTPLQEEWIKQNIHKLSSVKIVLGVGGGFDHAIGKQWRAPKFIQKTHIEWLWRFIIQPRKMLVRVWNAVPKFIWLVIKYKIQEKN